MVISIGNENDFDRRLSKFKHEPIIIKFSATWCDPCRAIAPFCNKLETEHGVKIYNVDIDGCPELADRYNIKSVPTFIFIYKKKVRKQITTSSETELEKIVLSFIRSVEKSKK